MTNNRRTRNFQGEYRNSKGQKSNLNVKVFPLLSAAILSIALVKGVQIGTKIADGPILESTNETNIEETTELSNADLEVINKFLKDNPYYLKEVVEEINHVVKSGEYSSQIAEDYGITIDDIKLLNPNVNTKSLREGEKLKLKKFTNLNELDEQIKILEAYFSEYIFHSNAISIARGDIGEIKEQQEFYKAILIGDAFIDGSIDTNTIYGMYTAIYTHYRQDNGKVSEDKKEEYLEALNSVYENLMSKNDTFNFIDLEKFTVYMKNGDTKTDDLRDINHSVYAKSKSR